MSCDPNTSSFNNNLIPILEKKKSIENDNSSQLCMNNSCGESLQNGLNVALTHASLQTNTKILEVGAKMIVI